MLHNVDEQNVLGTSFYKSLKFDAYNVCKNLLTLVLPPGAAALVSKISILFFFSMSKDIW